MLETLHLSENEILASICRDSFEHFVREFWEYVPGAGKAVWNWHLSVFCSELQQIAERVFANKPREYDLVVNVSPGTSKSTIFSILFHPWTWTRMPSARHLSASHTHSLALDLAAKSKAVIGSEKYKQLFPEIELKKDAVEYYQNTMGGDRHVCTVAGKTPMGFHAHFLSMDDAIDPQKMLSVAETENASHFVREVLPTRKVDKAVSVTIMVAQRLGLGDPTDVMLKEAQKEGAAPVRKVCLPAELTDDVTPVELRDKYVDGLMDPVRLNRNVLREFKARGALFYSTQFLQKPYAQEGGMFKPEYFNKRIKSAPFNCQRIRYVDRASTQDGGCYTAMVLIAKDPEGSYYIEHVVHGQWEPGQRNKIMRATALRDRAKYGPKYEPTYYVEAEGGSSGRDAWLGVARAMDGFVIKEHNVSRMGSKDVRAEPWAAQLAAGNVYVIDNGESRNEGRCDWDVQGFVDEHIRFKPEPGKRLGAYKDQVDAASGAYSLLAAERKMLPMRSFRIGDKSKKGLRFLVCTQQELDEETIEDHNCLLVSVVDPPILSPDGTEQVPGTALVPFANPLPLGGVAKLIAQTFIEVAGIEPAKYQDKWDVPVPPWGITPDKLVMQRDTGRKLWSFLLKKREPLPDLWVFVDKGDGRALSIAYAVCDSMALPREQTIHTLADPESEHAEPAPIQHVYDVVKSSRCLVIGFGE